MTTEEMREIAAKLQRVAQDAERGAYYHRYLICSQIWFAAAEICERLDRAAQPQELEK